MATPTRVLALRILRLSEQGGSTLADLLASEGRDLDARDRSFLHELVLGTVRNRGLLDHALTPLADRPFASLDPLVRGVLRLGAYQILKMDVPDRAAVAESVDLVRGGIPQAAGFVNAVLRRLAREGLPALPDAAREPLAWMATEGSLPAWLAERWIARLGASRAVARARAFLKTPPRVYRLNPRIVGAAERAEAAGLLPRPCAVPGAFEATAGRTTPLSEDGVLYLQDEGSQMVARLLPAEGRILDACAAPGGKATLAGDRLTSGFVAAAESSPRRLRTLAALVRRWGSANVHVLGADALRPPVPAGLDAVLLDAPCTGLGTLGRHPDIRWRMAPGDIPRNAERQRLLLEALAPLVGRGGTLVYAACSAEPEETDALLDAFLEAHPGWRIPSLPAWAAPFAEGRYARTGPEERGGDAFFAAALTREG